jgi:sugar lactone lactonase YvrE
MIKKCFILLLLALFVMPSGLTAFARDGVPYDTYFFTKDGRAVYTKTAYIPTRIIDGYGADEEARLSRPEGILISGAGELYVADTGNRRIAVFGRDGTFLRAYGEGTLRQPTGIFLRNDILYVADAGEEKVFLFDTGGELIAEHGRPATPLFGSATRFRPAKIAVDAAGMMYIVSPGSVNGLITIDAEGRFCGFFGANRAGVDWLRRLQRLIFTEEQLARLSSVVPTSPHNVSIDSEGLVYTVTQGVETGALKRFNLAGGNLLEGLPSFTASTADVALDTDGNMFIIDANVGVITMYTKDGIPLFIFGGSDVGQQRMGLFRSPSGIAVDPSGVLYVLDRERNNIQVLEPTEFARLIHAANALYQDGLYLESRQYWEEVLLRNELFEYAHQGIGMADFKSSDYIAAMDSFRLSRSPNDYSDAFWEWRRGWIMDNAAAAVIILITLLILWQAVRILGRKKGWFTPIAAWRDRMKSIRIVDDLLLPFRFIRHPIDTAYDIRRERKGGVIAATVWLALFTGLRIVSMYATGFIFNDVNIRHIRLGNEILLVAVPFALLILSNYLVSTISSGEGRLRDVYIVSASALTPVTLFFVPLILLSNVLSTMEGVVYSALHTLPLLWSGALIFVGIKEVHDYEIWVTVKNLVLTVFLAICAAVLFIIVYGLSDQLFSFISSLFGEVRIRE